MASLSLKHGVDNITHNITQFNRMETIHQFHKIPVKHAIVHITLKITNHLIC